MIKVELTNLQFYRHHMEIFDVLNRYGQELEVYSEGAILIDEQTLADDLMIILDLCSISDYPDLYLICDSEENAMLVKLSIPV